VGAPQTLASLDPLRPALLQWDWTPPPTADAHSCMLVVMDSPSDPIPAATQQVFDIAQLVTSEKRVGLKNLHVVDLLADAMRPIPWRMNAPKPAEHAQHLRLPALARADLKVGFLFSKAVSHSLAGAGRPKGLNVSRFSAADLERLKRYWLRTEMRSEASWAALVETFDLTQAYAVDPRSKGVDVPVPIRAGGREDILLIVRTGRIAPEGDAPLATLTLLQSDGDRRLVGGGSFVFRAARR
jgi:hypothetical protein